MDRCGHLTGTDAPGSRSWAMLMGVSGALDRMVPLESSCCVSPSSIVSRRCNVSKDIGHNFLRSIALYTTHTHTNALSQVPPPPCGDHRDGERERDKKTGKFLRNAPEADSPVDVTKKPSQASVYSYSAGGAREGDGTRNLIFLILFFYLQAVQEFPLFRAP
jgi:hypothetical protein